MKRKIYYVLDSDNRESYVIATSRQEAMSTVMRSGKTPIKCEYDEYETIEWYNQRGE